MVSLRERLLNVALLAAGVLLALVLLEVGARSIGYLQEVGRSFDIVITTYHKIPGARGYWLEFDRNNELEFKASVRYNNQGYRSDYDWAPQKSEGEYRIAVFGDSYTECETSDFSWVDVVHRKLASDPQLLAKLNKRTITVGNFGASGSGFHDFALEYLRVRQWFRPDMVVFAFIDEDFIRLVPTFHGLRNQVLQMPAAELGKTYRTIRDPGPKVVIPEFGGDLIAFRSGTGFLRSLHYAGNDLTAITDKARLANAKRFLARLAGWEKYVKTWDCISCRHIRETVPALFAPASAAAPDSSRAPETASDPYLAAFRESVAVVEESLLLLSLPAFYEVLDQNSRMAPTRPLKHLPRAYLDQPHLKFIFLQDLLPANATWEDKFSWYVLPYDGHPSNKGVELFGSIFADQLKAYLLAAESPPSFMTKEQALRLLAQGSLRAR